VINTINFCEDKTISNLLPIDGTTRMKYSDELRRRVLGRVVSVGHSFLASTVKVLESRAGALCEIEFYQCHSCTKCLIQCHFCDVNHVYGCCFHICRCASLVHDTGAELEHYEIDINAILTSSLQCHH